jgi:hypothetical protein
VVTPKYFGWLKMRYSIKQYGFLKGFIKYNPKLDNCRNQKIYRRDAETRRNITDGKIILETSVERAGVCGFPGAGQGATTKNGLFHSEKLQRRHAPGKACNPARSVLTKRVNAKYMTKLFRATMLRILASGQRRFLGSYHYPTKSLRLGVSAVNVFGSG